MGEILGITRRPRMTILITGGAGFIGSHLVKLTFEQTEHRVVINIDKLTYAGNLSSLVDCLENPDHIFIQADIANPSLLREIFEQHQPDAVIHLAAESHVDRSIDQPCDFIHTNIIGTYHLLQAALHHYRGLPTEKQTRFRFIHVSTDEVYGSLKNEDPRFTETTPYSPHSPYSASKAASDHLARAWHHTYGLPVIVTHSSNNYGPYQFPEKLIPVVILKCLHGEPIPIYGNGENIRDWLYVNDHCAALLAVLENGRPGETYNIGGNNELTNIDLVHRICSIFDEIYPEKKPHQSLITFIPDRPGHDFRYAIDSTKIQREIGWQATADFQNSLYLTVKWFLDQNSEPSA